MKKIRINNDFAFAWAIERNGLAENLSVAINKRLWIRNSTGTEVEINDYTIAGNIISVEVTPILAPIMGRYAFKFQYELPDLGLSDYERLCEVDVDAFIIVPRTAEADDSKDLLVASDMAIGFRGKDAYEVWLETHEGTLADYEAFIKGDTGNYGVVECVVNENMELEQHTLVGEPLDFSIVDGDLVLNEAGQTVNLGTVAIKDTYSYNEQRIGTWVNGKPIYRKVILLEDTADIDKVIQHNLNIDTYLRTDIVSNKKLGYDVVPVSPFIHYHLLEYDAVIFDTNSIRIEAMNLDDFTYHLILEYTKLP